MKKTISTPSRGNPFAGRLRRDYSKTFGHTRRLVFLALLTAFAVALHTVEAGLPNPTPWLRLGLANIITLLALVLFGFRAGVLVCVLRIVIGSIITIGLFGPVFFMALAGGLAGTVAMYLAWRYAKGYFSLIGISVIGAYTHSFTQVATAYFFFIRHGEVFILLPVFLVAAVATGFINGLGTDILYRHLRRLTFF
jgi:heptaprenyl diphosphate synthase